MGVRELRQSAVFSLVIFAVLSKATASQPHSCHCTDVAATTETLWGGNMAIEIDLRDKPVRTVNGIVFWPTEEPANNSLVQVFRRSHSDPLVRAPDQKDGVPVVACMTGADGAFAFSLPSGEYELRASVGRGTDVTHIFLTVKRWYFRSKKVKVVMQVGT
jgi:hypothetical protein